MVSTAEMKFASDRLYLRFKHSLHIKLGKTLEVPFLYALPQPYHDEPCRFLYFFKVV